MRNNFIFPDLIPVTNISGGSAAETWVVKDQDHNIFVRKFASGEHAKKLMIQSQWLREFKHRIYCPEVLKDGHLDDYYYYDMNFLNPAEPAYLKLQEAHSAHTTESINVALSQFNLIFEHLTPVKNRTDRENYIESKFHKNLVNAKNADRRFSDLADATEVVINGIHYPGLFTLMKDSAVQQVLRAVSEEDLYSTGHGDLTLSNLLLQGEAVAFLDPNPHFDFISQEQEFAKVLQSTVVKYEFFNDVKVNFNSSNSVTYSSGAIRDFTGTNKAILSSDTFKDLEISALYFHLAVHLARILPYIKPENKDKSYIFLAEIIKLLHSVSRSQYNLN